MVVARDNFVDDGGTVLTAVGRPGGRFAVVGWRALTRREPVASVDEDRQFVRFSHAWPFSKEGGGAVNGKRTTSRRDQRRASCLGAVRSAAYAGRGLARGRGCGRALRFRKVAAETVHWPGGGGHHDALEGTPPHGVRALGLERS